MLTALLIAVALIIVPVSAESTENTSVIREVSETSVAPGAEIEVTLFISGMQAGGIVETVPHSWSITGTDHPDERTNITGQSIVFSVIGDDEIVYTAKAGLNGGSITGLWDDILNSTSGVISPTVISVSGGGDSGGGGSSSSAASGISAGTNATGVLFSVNTTSGHPFTRNDGVVTGIRVSGDGNLEQLNLSVERTIQPSDLPAPEGIPYTFLAINASGLDDGNITRAEITFEVNASWMSAHLIDPSSIVLMRYHNATWTALPTESSGAAGGNATRFTAISPGFSLFAITGTETGTEATIAASSTPLTAATKKPVTIATPVHEARPNLSAAALKNGASPNMLVPILVIVLAVCGGAGYLLYSRRKKSEDAEQEETP